MNIFHEYDIRGVYARELNDDFAYLLGKALIRYSSPKKILVGYDSRNSSKKLFSNFTKAILEEGIDLIDAGLVTRPMLNYISWKEKYDLGVMITASHNPKEYNGFKFILNGKPLYYSNGLNDVEILVEKLQKEKFAISKKKGKIIPIDYIDKYVNFLSKNLSTEFQKYNSTKPLRVVVDCSSGASGEIVKKFLLKNGSVFKIINFEPDGDFPSHDPNPLVKGAMDKLCVEVKKFKADFGIIFDPDGDRVKFVDETGEIISNNYIDCMIIENFSSKQEKKSSKQISIVHDVISRRILSETILKKEFKDVVSKVGTSNIISNMISSYAVFGCEMSGHRYYQIMNNQDSGMMTLVYLLNVCYNKKLSKELSKYKKYVDLGELNYKMDSSADGKRIIAAIKHYYSVNLKKLGVLEISELDGIKIVCKDYWFTLRSSNTEPLMRLRIEGNDISKIEDMKKFIETFIKD